MPKGPPKKAKWSSSDDATLIATLHAERAKGNQADNSWKATTWTACEKALVGSEVSVEEIAIPSVSWARSLGAGT